MTPKEKMEHLYKILSTMDVPKQRINDWGWLLRNLGIRNGNHPQYEEAVTLIKTMWRCSHIL